MSTKMLASKIPIDSRALYLAINARDGYAAEKELPLVVRAVSKIRYLKGQGQEGLIYMSESPKLTESDFLAAYSGEILTTRQLLTHKDPRTHAYTISLAHEEEEYGVETELPVRYLSRRWLFSGWNELGVRGLAIFANHQIVNNEQRWPINELLSDEVHKKLIKNGKKKQNVSIVHELAMQLGTHEILFWQTNALHVSSLTFDEMIKKVHEVYLSTDYRVQVNYPANAQIARMLLDRTFILSNNSLDKSVVDILGGGAERNRLVHWRGAMCCRVTYIEKIPDVEIQKGDEILVTYGPEYQEYNSGDAKTFSLRRTTAYYPANRPYLKPFTRETDENDAKGNFFVRSLDVRNNSGMEKIIRDLVPLVLLFDNIDNEMPFVVNHLTMRFTTEYAPYHIKKPPYNDSAKFIRKLVSETLGLLAGEEYATIFNDEERHDSLVTLFVRTVHRLAEYIQADEMDRIAQAFYKASFIHFVPNKQALDKVNAILQRLRDERSRRSRELCSGEELSPLEEVSNARMLRNYYEIPLLGVTNLFYRDALYYMTGGDDNSLFAESLTDYNTAMRVYTASRDAFVELVMPVIHYASRVLGQQEFDMDVLVTSALDQKEYTNTLNGLKLMFIYRAEQFATHSRELDYRSLTIIYMRLFAMMRLLPLTQLELSWFDRLYRQYRALYVYITQKYILSSDNQTLDRVTPASPLLAPFDYPVIKKKWYARVLVF
jgi:hypothetical protein